MVRKLGMREKASDLEIELTERELALVSQIDFYPSAASHNADSWRPIADAMEELTRSLLERNAIPEARRKFFSDPTFFVGGHGRSHLQVFEKNGTRGDAIFRDPNFAKYRELSVSVRMGRCSCKAEPIESGYPVPGEPCLCGLPHCLPSRCQVLLFWGARK